MFPSFFSRRFLVPIWAVLTIGCGWAGLLTTELLFDSSEPCWYPYPVRIALLLAAIVFCLLSLMEAQRSSLPAWIKKLWISVSTVITLLWVLEIVATLFPSSSGGSDVIMGRNWFRLYWEVNELGFRDKNPMVLDREGVPNIIFLGDSYTAGYGIEKVDQRFSNIVGEELTNCADVFNIGMNGANTMDELKLLSNFPVVPDIVVLSHVKNDIEDSAPEGFVMTGQPSKEIKALFPRRMAQKSFVMQHSILINYVEFLIYNIRERMAYKKLMDSGMSLRDFLEGENRSLTYLSYYLNDEVMGVHIKEMDSIAQWCSSRNVKLIVVLFPMMTDLIGDSDWLINDPISRLLSPSNIEVINLTKELQKMNEKERIVSAIDPHPGPAAHLLVSKILKGRLVNALEAENCQLQN